MREGVDSLTYAHGVGVSDKKKLLGTASEIFYDPSQYTGMSAKGHRLLKKANAMTKTLEEQYDRHFVKSFLKQADIGNPAVLERLLPAKNHTAAGEIRRALLHAPDGSLDEPGKIMWDQLRTAKLATGIEDATKEGGFNSKAFDRWLSKQGGVDGRYMKELLSDSERARLRSVTTIGDTIRPSSSEGTSLFTKGLQIGGAQQTLGAMLAVGGVASGYGQDREINPLMIGAGGALALSPIAFAMLATNKTGAKYLTRQWRLIPGTKAAISNSSRIVSLWNRMEADRAKAQLRAKLKETRELRGPSTTASDIRKIGP